MRNLLLLGREDRGINRPAAAGIKRKIRARDTRPGVLWQREAQPEGTDTTPSQPYQFYPSKAAARGFRGGGVIPAPRTGIGAVCPRFRPSYGELCWEPACSIKAQDKGPQSQAPAKPRSAGLSEDAAPRSVWDFLRVLGGRKGEKSRRRAGLRGVTPEKRRKQYGTRK